MINKIGGIGLKYYDDVPIKEVLLLFLTPSSSLPHTTGIPGKKVREVRLYVQYKLQFLALFWSLS